VPQLLRHTPLALYGAGALVHQQAVNDTMFLLTVTAQLLVPEGGDGGCLTVSIPELARNASRQVMPLHVW